MPSFVLIVSKSSFDIVLAFLVLVNNSNYSTRVNFLRTLSDEEAVKKSPFSLELNEKPNEGGRVAIEFVRYFFNFRVRKNYLFWKRCCSISTSRRDYGQSTILELFVRNPAKISLKFTDKVPIFIDLSVSKTHFTDKPVFSSDLSVNF